jgi:protein-tyrosine phosphatase
MADMASLGLANATNARDLGGYPAAGGRWVRRGLLYRANALNRLTEADVEAVGRLGLACLVDFRHPHEIDLIGPDRLPSPPPPRHVALPLLDPEHDVFTTVSAALTGRAGTESLVRLRDGGAVAAMLELYRWLVTAPMARRSFAAALRLIASADALPLLFHCTAGKDRTGWLSALVLSTLGVDRAIITEDYLRTNGLNATGTAYVLAALSDRAQDPTLLLPLLEARLEYLDLAFAEVDRIHGGMAGYLRDGLDIDQATVVALRANLLD